MGRKVFLSCGNLSGSHQLSCQSLAFLNSDLGWPETSNSWYYSEIINHEFQSHEGAVRPPVARWQIPSMQQLCTVCMPWSLDSVVWIAYVPEPIMGQSEGEVQAGNKELQESTTLEPRGGYFHEEVPSCSK